MPLKRELARTTINDDENQRINKLNENFRLISDALAVSSTGEQLSGSKTVLALMPENTETTEFFDVLYPIGAIIQTTNAQDPRLQRGRWSQIQADALGIATSASSAGTYGYSTYYSLFMDNSSVESQVTSYLLNATLIVNNQEYSYGPVQIAAILGNIKWESNFNTGDLGDDVGGHNLGLFSFSDTGPRHAFLNWCEENNYDPYTVQSQMDFVFTTEIGGWWNDWTSSRAPNYEGRPTDANGNTLVDSDAKEFMEETSVEVATFSWMAAYEGCAYNASTSHLSSRVEAAQDYYNALVSDYSPTSALSSPVVARAFQEIGKPYLWGACGPDSFDCSGLVSYCLCGTYGTRLGTTETFMAWPQVSDPQPGDICTTTTHCGIYIGLEGQLGDYALKDEEGNLAYPESTPMMINAPHSGAYVEIDPVQSAMIYVRYQGDIGAFTGNSVDSSAFETNGYSTGMYASSTSTYNVLTYERIA